MRVIITGGRTYQLTPDDEAWLDTLGITHVRHGAARGADTCADRWAYTRAIPRHPYPVTSMDWNTYGTYAGPARNTAMLHDLIVDGDTELEPVAVIAFPGGRGTADMLKQAREAGVQIIKREQKVA